ncbi:MAG: glycoside hydrolase family 13 protein [Ignavibacteriaceae bacterium]|nr:glycoside hydrolase family 13 protein [Ignavibacteriaceae bacterium]
MKQKIVTTFLLSFSFLLFTSTENSFAQKKFPDWAKGIVWYQIFPERFANGDIANDPTAEEVFVNQKNIPDGWEITKWTSNWFAQSEWEKKSGHRGHGSFTSRRYGGDIQGIINKLDYLKELGVGAIYLNPMFEAVSMHKYDGSSYHHIDHTFGSYPVGDKKLMASETPDDPSTWKLTSADKLFFQLIKEVHTRGMHIIIDGVFNHTGEQFWAFQNVVKNQEHSKYKDWYRVKSFDDPKTEKNEFDYKGWWGTKSLPEFNRSETDLYPAVKKYIFDATKRWMDPNGDGNPEDGIDGWRLDVANEVPIGFWHDWNKEVKSLNSQAIILGELWQISKEYISENGVFDGLMNYNFAYAVCDLFINKEKKIPVSEFIKKLEEIDKAYPQENLYLLQNLMDSHDVDRLASMIVNPDRQFDRDNNGQNPKYSPSKPNADEYELQKLVAAFQMTYRGAPMIYHGDEVGMWGADDPHDRKPMVWSDLKYDDEVIDSTSGFQTGFGSYRVEVNNNLLDFYKKMTKVHNDSKALRLGDVNFVLQNDEKNIFAFTRLFENEKLLILFNLNEKEQKFSIEIKVQQLYDLLAKEKIETNNNPFSVVLSGKSFSIYKMD